MLCPDSTYEDVIVAYMSAYRSIKEISMVPSAGGLSGHSSHIDISGPADDGDRGRQKATPLVLQTTGSTG